MLKDLSGLVCRTLLTPPCVSILCSRGLQECEGRHREAGGRDEGEEGGGGGGVAQTAVGRATSEETVGHHVAPNGPIHTLLHNHF